MWWHVREEECVNTQHGGARDNGGAGEAADHHLPGGATIMAVFVTGALQQADHHLPGGATIIAVFVTVPLRQTRQWHKSVRGEEGERDGRTAPSRRNPAGDKVF